MVQIVINHCGRVPNVDAVDACFKFMHENFIKRMSIPISETMELTTDRGYFVRITESVHPDGSDSPCSVLFDIVNLEKEDA